MSTARIYRATRNAMQSGKATAGRWVLEYTPSETYEREPLMGWATMRDMRRQTRLTFSSKEAAIAYAEKHGLAYRLEDPSCIKSGGLRRKSYTDNFRHDRPRPWTH